MGAFFLSRKDLYRRRFPKISAHSTPTLQKRRHSVAFTRLEVSLPFTNNNYCMPRHMSVVLSVFRTLKNL
ncbi:uncharacterized protein LACBIDRAFT_296987 [Laccaria bicolor S238N-H82]|uniref:Predicted protein n=1 Tax=Laccaria bicolor (strain S238N-H82 / ATCC MYA-4686) TaxID=486041 RepID=B0D9Q5_LACBS|nr:uncharacterized protein LACBIDRAFT_296987 [Laccaria bicolor S238N-H82]EDR08621.1 predicted protein [Laccaria bicolor S238N-H82]|eukprot:XP_001880846.1 predicted protein [Laccaria bicolor S238N-H82]